MNICECSQCGLSASTLVWGFALLARDGWGMATGTMPTGAAERSWLCADCGSINERVARRLATLSSGPKARDHVRSAPLRVLVIDDHELLLRSMVRMLAGCQTVVAHGPQEALEVLEVGEFDAVVCDVMMPHLNGPELYELCYARSPELARRFVFASADPIAARPMIAEAVLRVGEQQMPLLLRKPTSRPLLMAAVASVAAGSAHESGTYMLHLPARTRQSSRY